MSLSPCACHELPAVTAVQPVVALSKVRSAEEGGTAPLSFPFVRFTRIHIMSSQDTPGRPKSSASRQQTQPHQRAQSGSPELDANDADSEKAKRKSRSRPADEQEHQTAVPEPKARQK
jgi:hypothetical protein